MRRLRFMLGQALTSMVRVPVLQLVAVTTIGAAVLVFCLLQVVTNTTEKFISNFSGQVGMVMFLKPGTSSEKLNALMTEVQAVAGVKQVNLTTAKEALNELQRSLGSERFTTEGLEMSLLPSSIQIELDIKTTPEQRRAAVEAIEALSATDELEALDTGDELSEKLSALSELIRIFGGLVALLVTVAVLFVISNTMRLAIHARENEVEIMQWVGAGHVFIRAPFYVEGAIQGLLSALLAIGLTRLIIHLTPLFSDALPVEFQTFRAEPLSAYFEVTLIASLMLIGMIASHLATSRYFKQQLKTWF